MGNNGNTNGAVFVPQFFWLNLFEFNGLRIWGTWGTWGTQFFREVERKAGRIVGKDTFLENLTRPYLFLCSPCSPNKKRGKILMGERIFGEHADVPQCSPSYDKPPGRQGTLEHAHHDEVRRKQPTEQLAKRSDRDVANLALDIFEHIRDLRPDAPPEMTPLFLRHIADVWEAGHRHEIADEIEFHRRLGSFQPYVLVQPVAAEQKTKRRMAQVAIKGSRRTSQ